MLKMVILLEKQFTYFNDTETLMDGYKMKLIDI